MILRPNPAASTSFLDDNVLIFNEHTQKIHIPQGATALLWCLLEDFPRKAELERAFAETTGVDLNTASEIAKTAIEQWSSADLLETPNVGSARDATKNNIQSYSEQTRPPMSAGNKTPNETYLKKNIKLAGQAICLTFDSGKMESLIWPLFEHLNDDKPATAPQIVMDCATDKDGYTIAFEHGPLERTKDLDEVAPVAKIALAQRMLHHGLYSIAFHAGAVIRNNNAILLPAISGSGKSTLAAALIASGFDYLTDDTLFYDGKSGVRGLDLCLGIKVGSVKPLTYLYPELSSLPTHKRPDGKMVKYLPPPRSSIDWRKRDAEKWWPVSHIVIPKFDPGAEYSLQTCTRLEIVKTLLIEGFAPSNRMSKAQFQNLTAMLGKVCCYTLTYNKTEQAIEALAKL